jgi:glycine/D-amino acid oxidase-like deaminating enzyme
MVGQGGTGIQTAPAAGELVAAIVAGTDVDRALGPARLR